MLDDIPILTYHKISTQREFGLTTIHPLQFEKQIEYLKNKGYETITFKDIYNNVKLQKKSVIITFDDGYGSVFEHAFPIIKKYNFKAVVFCITDFIGKESTWESFSVQKKFLHLDTHQLLHLIEAGWEIGSHTKKHRFLPMLKDDELIDEIKGSKEDLFNLLNEETISYCHPYGKSNKKIWRITSDSGYRFATGSMKLLTDNSPVDLMRRSIYSTDSMAEFIQKVEHSKSKRLNFLKELIIQQGAWVSIAGQFWKYLKR